MKTLILFSSESSRSPTFSIFPKLYELCEFCRRNPLETLYIYIYIYIYSFKVNLGDIKNCL